MRAVDRLTVADASVFPGFQVVPTLMVSEKRQPRYWKMLGRMNIAMASEYVG